MSDRIMAGYCQECMLFSGHKNICSKYNGVIGITPKTGVKHDQEKIRMELLSPIALFKMGEVMTYGAKKYSDENWRGGISYKRLLGAAIRHLLSYLQGESKDVETGISHIAHMMCCGMMILEFEETRPELDDRYKK